MNKSFEVNNLIQLSMLTKDENKDITSYILRAYQNPNAGLSVRFNGSKKEKLVLWLLRVSKGLCIARILKV